MPPKKKAATKKKVAKKKTTKKKAATKKTTRARGRPKWADGFIAHLRKTRSVSKSADRVKIHRRTAYKLRDSDEQFSEDWDDALEASVEDAEATGFELAFKGWREEVYYKGRKVGTKKKISPPLIMWFLERLRPDVWNIPKFDPMANSKDQPQGTTRVVFYPDPDEVRRQAEAREKEQNG